MSTFYETPLRSNELYHWKYKRKYRGPSGDWVYVYDDGSMSDRGKTETTQSETDAWGNTTETKQQVITNPNRWFTKKSTSENTTTNTTVSDGQTRTTTKHTKTETVERGKLHIFKMNLQRKISEIPGKTIKRAKYNWNYQQSMKTNRKKGESGYEYYKRYKKEHGG